jgi:hypothetical protein
MPGAPEYPAQPSVLAVVPGARLAVREIGREEGMQTTGRIVGHLLQADATGASPAVRDRNGADHEYLAVMAAPAAAGQGIVRRSGDRSCRGRRSRFPRPRRARPGGCDRRPPCCAAVWHTTARPICRSRGRAGVAAAAPRCRCNGWPSDRRPRTIGSAAAWSGA